MPWLMQGMPGQIMQPGTGDQCFLSQKRCWAHSHHSTVKTREIRFMDFRNGLHLTGLGFKGKGKVNLVLEPFHDKKFDNDVQWQWNADACEQCSMG
eukprot:2443512-Amphidinium_carterae.1